MKWKICCLQRPQTTAKQKAMQTGVKHCVSEGCSGPLLHVLVQLENGVGSWVM